MRIERADTCIEAMKKLSDGDTMMTLSIKTRHGLRRIQRAMKMLVEMGCVARNESRSLEHGGRVITYSPTHKPLPARIKLQVTARLLEAIAALGSDSTDPTDQSVVWTLRKRLIERIPGQNRIS